MPVGFRSASTATANGGNTVAVPYPAGVSGGDLLLLIEWADTDGTTTALAVPSGWAQTGSDITKVSASPMGRLFWKAATGSESGSLTCSISSSASTVATMLALTGADTTSPVRTALTPASGTGTSVTAPSLSGGQVDDMLLTFHAAQKINSFSFGTVSGMTEAGDAWSGYVAAATDYLVLGSTAATGTKTATASTSPDSQWRAASIIIAQGAPSGPEPGRFLLAA